MTALSFTIPTRPLSWKRTDGKGGAKYTPPAQRAYQALVRGYAVQAVQRAKLRGVKWPVTGHLYAVSLVFCMPTHAEPDIDNLQKNVLDACQGGKRHEPVLWGNDSAVAYVSAARVYDKHNPRTVVLVRAIDDAELCALVLPLLDANAEARMR